MNNIVFCFILSVVFISANAQEEFEALSAKERIEIANREREEAKGDVEFQGLMQKGHQLFEGKHYLKAIRAYEEAADRRPYNVYPKVIIADIELSMKDTLAVLREAEKRELEKSTQEKKKKEEREVQKDDGKTEQPDDPIKRLDEWEAQEREKRQSQRDAEDRKKRTPPPVIEVNGDVQKVSMEDYRKELGEQYPSGVTETITEEGNKVITTRVVVRDGRGDQYKKVVHDWGGVFYFKNGDAVTERVWNQETTGQ